MFERCYLSKLALPKQVVESLSSVFHFIVLKVMIIKGYLCIVVLKDFQTESPAHQPSPFSPFNFSL